MNLKLFYSPGACSMSCHIALVEAKLPHEAVNVGRNAEAGVRQAYLAINPLGAVPALQIDGKHVLTQNIAILEYIADQKPTSHLLPAAGTLERAETMKWLSLVATDLHSAFVPLFGLSNFTSDAHAQEDVKKWAVKRITQLLTLINKHLEDKTYLVGDHLSVADCYLFPVFQWTIPTGIPTEQFTALHRYSDAIAKLPSVMTVREHEAAKVH
jgi:glutathione S-transferase